MGTNRLIATLGILMLLLASCKDTGTGPSPGPGGTSGPTSPSVAAVTPDSAAIGDTLRIVGGGFGATRGTSTVQFSGAAAAVYASWSDGEILVSVPAGATTGTVRVLVDTLQSGTRPFRLLPIAEARVSFSSTVAPLFSANGCTGCHGGTNNLFVDSYANLMSGSSLHGPVVIPYNGEGSVLVKKLRGTAGFGVRMPASGPPYLSNADIDLISRWIKQGAKNN